MLFPTLTFGIFFLIVYTACWLLRGSNEWRKSGPGEKFSVPGNSSFDIRVAQAYHYICHFG